MEFDGKEIKMIVAIFSKEQYDVNFLKQFFIDNKIEIEKDEDDNVWIAGVFGTKISRKTFNQLLFELTKQNQSFELNLESDDEYIYEQYIYNIGDDFITKNFVKDKSNNGIEHLMNMLFNEQKETIKINDLIKE